MGQRFFSAAEANAALALVRPIAADLVDLHRRLRTLHQEFRARRRNSGTSQEELDAATSQIDALTAQFRACAEELVEIGVQLKDAERGLVDFPGRIDGDRVLLCWQLGEPRVEWYHREEDGFGGRRRIPEPVHVE